jgi:integrase
MQTKLTVHLVRTLTQVTPPEKEVVVFDTVLQRLFLRVRPPPRPGQPWSSAYFARFTTVDGRERKVKVGNPATMDIDDARKAARMVLAVVDRGGDPVAEKAEQRRRRLNLREAADAYAASPEFAKKSTRSQTNDRAYLRLHIVHHLGNLLLADLNLQHARRLLQAVETDQRRNRNGRRLGGVAAAQKAAQLLSTLLAWACAENLLERHPLRGLLRLPASPPRETVITTPEEYARLFTAMDDMLAEGKLRPAVRAFITVAALTGMRRGELQQLLWRDVDLGQRRITLTNSKGAKLARGGPRTEFVSLPPFAAAAIAAIRCDDADDYDPVFTPQPGARALYVNADWLRIRDRAGLPVGLVLHSLRHSAGTVAVIAGLSGPEVQRLLRHRSPGVTARYIHLADQVRLQDRALGHLAPPLPITKVAS